MTARTWARFLPHDLLAAISSRIVNEGERASTAFVYDISFEATVDD